MKRRDQIQRHELPFCRAYKEELQEVIDLMTVDGDKPELISGAYEFEDADELFQYLGDDGKHEIEISRSQPSISFRSFGFTSASIEAYSSTDAGIALFHRVVDALKHCEARKPIRHRSWAAGVAGGLAGLGFFSSSAHRHSWQSVPYGLLCLTGLALTAWVFTASYKNGTTFYGVSRTARKTFWQRKRDDILVAVISAFLGGVLGVGATLLTQAVSGK